jgi:hypothetical protein
VSDQRVVVWVQEFYDRDILQLQWNDPETGRRRTKSTGTADPRVAERMRADQEADLNAGRYQEPSKLDWERFRQMFEEEYEVQSGLRRV